MTVVEDSALTLSHTRCYRLSCPDCWPLVVVRRGLALKQSMKELESVYWGIVPPAQLPTLRQQKRRVEAQSTVALYHGTSTAAVLASANLTPRTNILIQSDVSMAIRWWIEYGLTYHLKKMYSDWDYKPTARVQHLFSGDSDTIAKIMEVARISKGDRIENVDALRSKVYAIAAELNAPDDDYP